MIEFFVQCVVVGFAVIAAGVKSLRFAPSELSDFEVARLAKQGKDAAIAEQALRTARPLLVAMQRLLSVLLGIIIIVLLASVYTFGWAILWALLWLIVIELLETQIWLRSFAEELADRHQDKLLRAARILRPLLKFIADRQLLDGSRQVKFYSKEELLNVVEADKGTLSKEEALLITQSLKYSDIKIRDVMTPRSVVTTVDKTDTIGPVLLDRLHKSGQSRFPVIEGDIDHVVGMLYMHDLVPLKPKVKRVSDAMNDKVFYVHEEKTLDHALHAFLRTRRHLFIVVNEFEETTGVISIEDILETIIGRKIVDEFDQYEDLRAVAKLAATARSRSASGTHV